VNSTSLTPDEIRAAAETHRELGPDYQAAVIESFLDKVGLEIDARVDARVAAFPPGRRSPARSGRGGGLALAILSLVAGIPLTAIALGVDHSTGLIALIVIWLGMTAINVAYAAHSRSWPGGVSGPAAQGRPGAR